MASLCPRAQDRRGHIGSIRADVEGAVAAFWAPPRHSGDTRGLPSLLPAQEAGRARGQHDQDRTGIASGMSAPSIRRFGSGPLASAVLCASGSSPYPRGGGQATRLDRDAARSVVRDPGIDDWRANVGSARSDVGPRGLRAPHDRLATSGAIPDEQAAYGRTDEQSGRRGAAMGVLGLSIGTCDRVGWKAGCQREEGDSHGLATIRRRMQPSRLPAHGSGAHGRGGCAYEQNRTVPRAHVGQGDRSDLREVFAVLHARRERGARLVVRYIGTKRAPGSKPGSPWKRWWARLGLNQRPLRCERKPPTQFCGFLRYDWQNFANLNRFRSRYGLIDCTLRTKQSRPARQASSEALTTDEVRYG